MMHMVKRLVLLVSGAAALGFSPAAASPPEKMQLCMTCHGEDGLSRIPNAPNIAGHPEMYLVKALEAYRGGERRDEMMSVVAKELTDEDIAALAAWYSAIEVTVKVPGQ